MSKTTQHIEKLKPCPFCGGDDLHLGLVARDTLKNSGLIFEIECMECGLLFKKDTKDESHIIKTWNTRSA